MFHCQYVTVLLSHFRLGTVFQMLSRRSCFFPSPIKADVKRGSFLSPFSWFLSFSCSVGHLTGSQGHPILPEVDRSVWQWHTIPMASVWLWWASSSVLSVRLLFYLLVQLFVVLQSGCCGGRPPLLCVCLSGCVCVFMSACTTVCVQLCVFVCACICLSVCLHLSLYVCVCLFVCLHLSLYVCVSVSPLFFLSCLCFASQSLPVCTIFLAFWVCQQLCSAMLSVTTEQHSSLSFHSFSAFMFRMSAVFGGVYMLQRDVTALLLTDDSKRSVV